MLEFPEQTLGASAVAFSRLCRQAETFAAASMDHSEAGMFSESVSNAVDKAAESLENWTRFLSWATRALLNAAVWWCVKMLREVRNS